MTLVWRYTIASLSSSPSVSFPSIVILLRTCKTIRNLEQVHTQIIRQGAEQDHFLTTLFISLCNSLSSNIVYSTSVFKRVIQPNSYLWNTLIKGYCQHTSLSEAFSVFQFMKQSFRVVPDKYTFPLLIKLCSNELALREGRAIHCLTVRYGTENDVFVGSSLIDMYGKCRDIACARQVFDGMPSKNEVSWTAMIVGYTNVGDVLKAKELFDEMPQRNLASWNAMICGFSRYGQLGFARKLFEEMPEKNVVSFTTMIDGYAKAGDMASARFLFDQSPDRDIVSWSALISGYVQNGLPNEAMKFFFEMLSGNVKPDEFVMVSLMSACSKVGRSDLAKWIDSYVSEGLFDCRRPHVAAALIDMNIKCGNLDRATLLFEEMPKRDLISYCSMVQGLSIHGRAAQALDLFSKMLNEGLTPDTVAFTVILTACSHGGLVEEGCRYFDSMINDYGIEPSRDHYACMVDLLGRSGELSAAYDLIKSMPVEPHAGTWGALLGACEKHYNIELGMEIVGRLFELEPQNGGTYILLSNIYAAADRWLDVSLLRQKMNENGIRKICGCSWLLTSPFTTAFLNSVSSPQRNGFTTHPP